MQILAFVTQKGGTGKSTLAASLAVAASEAGEKVAILDMDPQGSLVSWRAQRDRADIEVSAVEPILLASTLALLDRKGVSFCIIDTEGAGSEAARLAMGVADLCVIPVRPNAFDLWASDLTRRTVRSLGKEGVFLLNQCPPLHQGQRVQAGVKSLAAAEEMRLLWKSVARRMGLMDAEPVIPDLVAEQTTETVSA